MSTDKIYQKSDDLESTFPPILVALQYVRIPYSDAEAPVSRWLTLSADCVFARKRLTVGIWKISDARGTVIDEGFC